MKNVKTLCQWIRPENYANHQIQINNVESVNLQQIAETLAQLQAAKEIREYQETARGYKANLRNGQQVSIDIENQEITVNSQDKSGFKTAMKMAVAAEVSHIGLKHMEKTVQKYHAYAEAKSAGLEVQGLDAKEMNQFEKKYQEEAAKFTP